MPSNLGDLCDRWGTVVSEFSQYRDFCRDVPPAAAYEIQRLQRQLADAVQRETAYRRVIVENLGESHLPGVKYTLEIFSPEDVYSWLNETQQNVLCALYEMGAFGELFAVSRNDLAALAGYDPRTVSDVTGLLGSIGQPLVATKMGRRGGTWLTVEGREVASVRSAKYAKSLQEETPAGQKIKCAG